MVTVAEILKLPCFADCTVLSGLSGLDRAVRGWNVAERADFHLWIKGGEFIMSMLSFATDPNTEEEVAGWVQSLADSGASALGIKRSVYRGNPPRFLLELGDRNGFPIIEMDDDLSLPEAGEAILTRVLDSRVEILKKALDALSEMANAAVDGWVPGLIRQLAMTFGNPILLETPNLHLAGVGGVYSGKENSIISARRAPDCVADIAEKLGDIGAYETFPHLGLRRIRHEFSLWGETFRQVTFPVEAAGIIYGYLSIILVNREFDSDDLLMMRTASNVITLIALNDATYSLAEEVRHELFTAMIDPEQEIAAEEQARLYGFDYQTPTFCVLAKPKEAITSGWIVDEAAVKKLVGEIQAIDRGALVMHHAGSIVVFCHVLDDAAAKKQHIVRRGYPERLEYVLSVLGNLKNLPALRFGAGRPGEGMAQIRAGFEEALASIRIAERFGLSGTGLIGRTPIVKYYDILDSLMRDERRARNFLEDVLGPLMVSNVKHLDEYCDTLEAYLQYGKNMAEIYRNTGLHRNTVKYRIAKMQEILGADLNDIQAGLSIWLALQIRKFFSADYGGRESRSESGAVVHGVYAE